LPLGINFGLKENGWVAGPAIEALGGIIKEGKIFCLMMFRYV